MSFDELLELGKERTPPVLPPSQDDAAVIMYTSGSTGNPKGVLLSHRNLVAAIAGLSPSIPHLSKDDRYVAYLPLAHVLELAAELCILSVGGVLGYSNKATLKDEDVVDEEGRPRGDLSALRPTLMAAVPLIMDRIRDGVLAKVAASSLPLRWLFRFAFYMKRRALLAGRSTALWDFMVFNKVRQKLGGSLRLMISGGAPLAAETQLFMAVAFCCPVGQGWGCTETCGCGTITHPADVACGPVGAPVPSCQIKLVSRPEMGYTTEDRPLPRGEAYIGGPSVAQGYFRHPVKTKAAFFEDQYGERWFRTGDVCQWNAGDGTLTIIDRCSDLIKLAGGEYIALGNIESVLRRNKLVENIAVCADPHKKFPVALVVPDRKALANVFGSISSEDDDDAYGANVVSGVLKALQATAKESGLKRFETPRAICLCREEWSPSNGLLTETQKLKRYQINKRYKEQIVRLYGL